MRVPVIMLLVIWATTTARSVLVGQATQPSNDAGLLYARAANLLDSKIVCPSDSNYDFPIGSDQWRQMEADAMKANAPALELAHEARSINEAHWPNDAVELNPSLSLCRALSNELADAANEQAFRGDEAGALETIRDELHLADLLLVDGRRQNKLVMVLVSGGIEAEAVVRLEIIASNLKLEPDDAHPKLRVSAVAQLSRGLLVPLYDVKSLAGLGADADDESHRDRIIETLKRVNTERAFAGMSLACQAYRSSKGNWPESLDDFHGSYTIPIDPWGDGKQTLGYTLIKGGLPDGSDRPLLYARANSTDGLFYRIDEPQYGWYNNDGSKRPVKVQKHGGQFRDVAPRDRAPGPKPDPTTRPFD